MTADYSPIMKAFRIQQISTGCWPLDMKSDVANLVYRFYSWIILITYTGKIFSEITYIYNHTGDVYILGEMFIIFFTGLTFQVRSMNIFYRAKFYQTVIEFFRDEISLSVYWKHSKKTIKIAKKLEKEGKYLSIIFTVTFMIGYCLFYLLTIFANIYNGSFEKDSEIPMLSPLSLALPYDNHFNKINWSVTYVLEAFFGYICLGSVFCQDIMLCYFILHIIGHLKILIVRLKQLDILSDSAEEHEEENEDMEQITDFRDIEKTWIKYSADEEKIIYAKLRECLLHYALVLRFFNDLQDVFGVVFLNNFMYDVSCICLLGLQITSSSSYVVIRFTLFFMGSVAKLMAVCYYCDKLAGQSTKLCKAVYFTPWPNLSKRTKSTLYFLLMRTQIPLQFSAMGFVSVTVETMATILKTSFSYFTILRSFDE